MLHSSTQMQQLDFWYRVTIFKVASDWKIQSILHWRTVKVTVTEARKYLSFEKGPPGIFCIRLPRKEVCKAVCFFFSNCDLWEHKMFWHLLGCWQTLRYCLFEWAPQNHAKSKRVYVICVLALTLNPLCGVKKAGKSRDSPYVATRTPCVS